MRRPVRLGARIRAGFRLRSIRSLARAVVPEENPHTMSYTHTHAHTLVNEARKAAAEEEAYMLLPRATGREAEARALPGVGREAPRTWIASMTPEEVSAPPE